MVLGKRGMRRVHLVEAQDDMGGTHALDPAASGPRRVGPHRQLPQDPARQAQERRVHPEHEALREGRRRVRRRDRRSSPPARTGRRTASTVPRTKRSTVPTPSLAWQATPEQIMGEGKQLPGESVVVFDNDGYFMGVSLAEKLARGGQEGHADDAARHGRAVHALHARGAEPAPQAAQARRRDRALPPAVAGRGGRGRGDPRLRRGGARASPSPPTASSG